MGLLASIDEVSQFHELLLAEPLRGRFGPGAFAYGWVVPVGIAVVVVAVMFGSWLYRQHSPAGRYIILGAAVYLLGALGLELFEGWWQTVGGIGRSDGVRSAVYYVATGVEEVMEMIGVGIAIYGLLMAVERAQITLGVAALPMLRAETKSSRDL